MVVHQSAINMAADADSDDKAVSAALVVTATTDYLLESYHSYL